MKWAAGAMMSVATPAAAQELKAPTPVVYTRTLNMDAGGVNQGWSDFKANRLEQWKSDLNDITQQRQKMANIIASLETTNNPATQEPQIREMLNFDHFSTFANRAITQTEQALRQEFETMQDLKFEQAGLEEAMKFLQSVKEQKQPINEAANTSEQVLLKKTEAEKKSAEETLKNARDTRNYRRRLIYKNGLPLSQQEKNTYQGLISGYTNARLAYRSALQNHARQIERTQIMSALMPLSAEERQNRLIKLETALQQKIEANAARMTENAKPYEQAYIDRMVQLFNLDDKLSQLWKNPTGEYRVTLTKEDLQTLRDAMAMYLKSNESHLEFMNGAIAGLTKNSALDLRIRTDEALNPWPKNFMIRTASDQEIVAYGENYFQQLMAELPQAGSLSKAVEMTAQKSLKLQLQSNNTITGKGLQFPQVSTQTVNSWNLQDKNVKRKVIIIMGGKSSATDSIPDSGKVSTFKAKLKEHFSVKEDDVTVLNQPTEAQVSAAFTALKEQGGADTEVLILMQGHGATAWFDEKLKPEQRYLQGSAHGLFSAKTDSNYLTEVWLHEDFMKEQAQKLAGFKSGLLILFSCHSGAWIAKKPSIAEEQDYSNPFKNDEISQQFRSLKPVDGYSQSG